MITISAKTETEYPTGSSNAGDGMVIRWSQNRISQDISITIGGWDDQLIRVPFNNFNNYYCSTKDAS